VTQRRWRFSKETWIAFLSILGIAVYLVARFLFHLPPRISNWSLIAVLVAGTPLLFDLLKKLIALEVGSDALAGISIITSAILGEYLAGAIIVLMLAGGTALELYATHRASAVLSALAKRLPSEAHRLTASGIVDVRTADVQIADRLVVLPHEICPADGTVVEGFTGRWTSRTSPASRFRSPKRPAPRSCRERSTVPRR
jgi:cation transport ATPase